MKSVQHVVAAAAAGHASVMSSSVRPHRRQPTRLLCPWDSPGKNAGVSCHFLLQCMKVKSQSEVAQSRPHGLQPTRLLHPWDFPGKSTGVGLRLYKHCYLIFFLSYQSFSPVLITIPFPLSITFKSPKFHLQIWGLKYSRSSITLIQFNPF